MGREKTILQKSVSVLKVMLTVCLLFAVPACGKAAEAEENSNTVQDTAQFQTDNSSKEETEPEQETDAVDTEETEEVTVQTDQITIKVGENTLTAVLENNESAKALKELLEDGALTISASNYGGFEKVCSLGRSLPKNDSQMTTQAGDICLYTGNQIVIFYGSNFWAYTKLGRVSEADAAELERILGGEETEITISLGEE